MGNSREQMYAIWHARHARPREMAKRTRSPTRPTDRKAYQGGHTPLRRQQKGRSGRAAPQATPYADARRGATASTPPPYSGIKIIEWCKWPLADAWHIRHVHGAVHVPHVGLGPTGRTNPALDALAPEGEGS